MSTKQKYSDKCANARNGVVLLVVLALMALFAALTAAFMVYTTNYRRSAELAAVQLKGEIVPANSGFTGTDLALDKLLTGGLDSVIGPYSILENLYGYSKDQITGNFSTATADNGGIKITITPAPDKNLLGKVVTITKMPTNGAAAKERQRLFTDANSSFIIDADDTSITIAPFPIANEAYNTAANQVGVLKNTESEFVINLPAFSGTGAGYETGAASEAWLSKTDLAPGGKPFADKPFALRPNILAPNKDNSKQMFKEYLENNTVLMNPDYNAPDYLTMFLAWNQLEKDDSGNYKLKSVIPSFHRPQLVKYWSDYGDQAELRKYVLRPLPQDHPLFTGSNPAAKKGIQGQLTPIKFLTEGPWDVDNDGDGIADSIWLDAGLPARFDERTKSWYKPLVAYYVVDMDGRINVNTVGESATATTGQGLGAAEIASNTIPDAAIEGRYGTDKKPDKNADWSDWITKPYEKGGLNPDWRGTAKIDIDEFGNRNPEIESPEDAAKNPYFFNPYQPAGDDKPFATDDLEFLIRSISDLDYNNLATTRLRELLGDTFDNKNPQAAKHRYTVTTRSSDIPSPLKTVTTDTEHIGLYEYIKKTIYNNDEDRAKALWKLLPEEIRRGEKVDLNRLTHRSDWNTGGDELLKAKAKFAQEMFYLLCVLCYERIENTTPNYTEASLPNKKDLYGLLAQWSINLVEFIDPDSTMTPFLYHNEPFNMPKAYDNAEEIAQLLGTDSAAPWSNNHTLIWGFEKPEVAITETLAVHNRGVADAAGNSDGGRVGNDDDDFDQVIRPQGSLFVELYRPGDKNQTAYPEGSVYDEDGKIDMAKKTGDGDYVWRLAISGKTNATVKDVATDKKNDAYSYVCEGDAVTGRNAVPEMPQWIKDNTDTAPVVLDRFIWFGNVPPPAKTYTDGRDVLTDNMYFVRDMDTGKVKLENDNYLVIVPRPETSFQSLLYDGTTVSKFGSPDPNGKHINAEDIEKNAKVSTVMVATTWNRFRGVNVSEPLIKDLVNTQDTYPAFPADEPFDKGELAAYGTIPCYRSIYLQRLADPNRSYHPKTNPYITVDFSMLDLHVITSESDSAGYSYGQEPNVEKDNLDENGFSKYFGSRSFEDLNFGNQTPAANRYINLWQRRNFKEGIYGGAKCGLPLVTTDTFHSFGGRSETNSNWHYAHIPWHNAPLSNSYELMLVPATNAARFCVEFTDMLDWQSGDITEDPRGSLGTGQFRVGFHKDNDAAKSYSPYFDYTDEKESATVKTLRLSKIFDYVHVPSKFAGTVADWTGTAPDKKAEYSMREPGKMNINTLNEASWEALKGGRNYPDALEKRLPFNAFNAVEKTGNRYLYPSEFPQPFRSVQGANLVPPLKASTSDTLVPEHSAEATLIGAVKKDLQADDPYSMYEKLTRLSDMTTTRSNVFAVWITIGYFHAEKFESATKLKERYPELEWRIANDAIFKAVYPDGLVFGAEKGLDNGTVNRQRAFYLIDRSVPVGFQRGKQLNSRNVIIQSRGL